MLPTFVWSVPVKEKNGWDVSVLISSIHFHRHVYAFIFSSVVFCKMEGIFKCCLQRKMEMYAKYSMFSSTLYHGIKQFAAHLFVLGEFLCVYKFITLPFCNLAVCTAFIPNKFHSCHFCPMVKNRVEILHLLLLLLSGKYFNELSHIYWDVYLHKNVLFC